MRFQPYPLCTCCIEAVTHLTTVTSRAYVGDGLSKYERIQCAGCGKTYDFEDVPPNDGCGSRIDFHLDIDSLRRRVDKEGLGKRTGGIWRYFDFMPLRKRENALTLGEGNTPLVKSERLAEYLGVKHLYLKIETVNPSGSFKDRPICVGVSRAAEDGGETVAAASSGNAAASMATYAARAGLDTVVLVPEKTPTGKTVHLQTLGAHVFRVKKEEEGVDPTTKLLKEACSEFGWIPVPSFGPFNCFQFEGNKTIGYEISEQMEWKPPDWILFPTGSGGLMAGTMKGFVEYEKLGFIDKTPQPVVVQPEGCSPIVRAFQQKADPSHIEPWDSNETVAGGLADPFPWDGDAALNYLSDLDGEVVSVTDEKIKEYVVRLASFEGVFAEPSGVAALAGLEALLAKGVIDSRDTVVVPITGSGFKDLDLAKNLTAEAPIIRPRTQELMKHLGGC
ncbi:threonine synthase [Candidatus Thorarchaeota archaeon]|nr:MAG: threonine synthase [Candidatus Thorarchaeota archaeon]